MADTEKMSLRRTSPIFNLVFIKRLVTDTLHEMSKMCRQVSELSSVHSPRLVSRPLIMVSKRLYDCLLAQHPPVDVRCLRSLSRHLIMTI